MQAYWIEGGKRRKLEGNISFPVTRLSQVDLRRWPEGEPIAAGEAEQRWRGAGSEWSVGVVMLHDGAAFHVEGNQIRRIATPSAMRMWNLNTKPCLTVTPEQLAAKVEGLPIIAPPKLCYVL